MSVEAFPLAWPDGWPRTSWDKRGKSRFAGQTYNQITELQRQLRLLGASNVVISSNVPVRNDGLPYADAARRRYDDPGVAIYFTLNGKALSMARDKYWTPWENMRSLVLTIDGLRSMERHGGSTMMQRAFSGFASLAPPDWKKPWREVFGVKPDWEGDIRELFKQKAKHRHPDAGGNDDLMAELNVAFAEAKRELNLE
jgi:hypothetical protein